MRERPLFRERKKKHWGLRLALLAAGFGALGVVIGKVSMPTDPALESSVRDRIALEVDRAPASATDTTSIPLTVEAPTKPASEGMVAMLPAIERPRLPALTDTPALTEQPNLTPEEMLAEPEKAAAGMKLKEVEVRSGDSLSTIFSRIGLGYREVHAVMELGDEVQRLQRIRPGQKMTFRLSPDNEFLGLSYDINATRTLDIQRDDDGLIASEIEHEVQVRQTYNEGVINTSLYVSAINAGVSPNLVMELAEIFGWKIDFLRDVREGDEFRILYETRYRDGEEIGTGNVLAAEFINQGKSHQAVRYTSPEGQTAYYTPDGESLERGFLRYPVEFSRISSRFSLNRQHPIYGTMRAHRGVDLAAPTGTPIRAASSGRVDFVGWQNGYGKVIYIEHDQRITTVYAHLSRFNNRLRKGSTVSQGEVIGYVGMTGAATGPHLHYEFRVNGQHKDPLKVELPEAAPIPSEHRRDFLAQTQGLLDTMASLSQSQQQAQAGSATVAQVSDNAAAE